MNNELDDLMGVETSPVELKEIVGAPLEPISLPDGAVRNRAAHLALLSPDSSMVVDNYTTMVAEAQNGSEAITQGIQNQVLSQMEQEDMNNFMNVLSDPKIPLERKKLLVKNHAIDNVRRDFGTKLLTNNLEKPSEGESIEAERARVDSTASVIREIYYQREREQGLINAFAANLDSESARAVYEMSSAIVAPFSQNILMANIAQSAKDGNFWKGLKAFLAPGHAKMDMRKELEQMPLNQKEEFTKALLANIDKNSETLFANNNQYAKYQLLQEIAGQGDYSDLDKWVDTLSSVLDIVGLGAAARSPKAAKQLDKGSGAAAGKKAAVEASGAIKTDVPKVDVTDLAQVTSKPTRGVFDDKIAQLEAQKAEILGKAGNQLGKGEVTQLNADKKALINSIPDRNALAKDIQEAQGITSKAAKEQADKIIESRKLDVDAQVKRIDSMLESNKEASTLTQRIASLEKQIQTLQKNNTDIFIKKTVLADDISRIEMNSVVRVAHPSTPMEIVKLANPQQSRNVFETIFKSEGDDVAKGLAGTTKQQAMANAIFPQVNVGGKAATQTVDVQRNLRKALQVPDSIYKAIYDDGGIMYTTQEKAEALANVKRDFESASGLSLRENMSGFSQDGLRIKIDAVYGLPEGDFINARQAMEQAKLALRRYGVLDEDIEILRKEGLDYVPVPIKEVDGIDGAYAIRVNTFHEVDPTDITYFERGDVKWNLFDRLPVTQWGTQGSLQSHLMDASSMLSPKYTQGAITATDRSAKFEKIMLDIADDFAEIFVKLPKKEQTAINEYIKKANFEGLAFDPVAVKTAYPISDKGIEAIRNWRKFWDAHYYLENLDVIRTLNSQGYNLFKNANAEFIAKAAAKDGSIGKVYDPDLDQIVQLSRQEMDDLYNAGGHYAKLRRPSEFHGEIVEHAIVRNTPSSYLRQIRDSDQILNYKEGYYQIQYKAARFVDEISIGANGQEVRRAVAVAKDTPEAKAFAERMNQNAAPGVIYEQRADNRALQRGSDDWFDVNSAAGRIAQRHRGKLLETGAGVNHLGDGSYILDPVTSAVRAAKSVAGRTITRPVIEAAKQRFMAQYDHLLQGNGKGGKDFPLNSSDIGRTGGTVAKDVADARTTFNYIRYLENGYVNAIDTGYKQLLHTIAEMLGNIGTGKAQRAALSAAEVSPMQAAKGTVFTAYIATNPIRQLIIQPHQVVRTWAYNPTGWLSGEVPKLITGYIHHKLGGGQLKGATGQKMKDFFDFVESSGMMQAVDKQNLVRGALLDAADSTNKALRVADKPITLMRRVGFDLGEMGNNLGHLAAVYDKYERRGMNLKDLAVRDEAYSTTRAISYDMNFAGDMAYNQTAANAVLQFLQIPHKAMLNYTNRRIPLQDRMNLLMGDVLFWGPPTLLVSEWLGGDILPENHTARDFVVYGFESAFLNYAFQELVGDEDFSVDWSSLAPIDAQGWYKMFYGFLTGGPMQAVANSPAGQLLGEQGRIRDFIRTMGRFFAGFTPVDETPTSFTQVLQSFANISSGFSNATQAYAMLEAEKRIGKYGQIISDNVHFTEAMMKIAGFQTSTQRDRWALIESINKDKKKLEADIKQDVKEIAKYYQNQFNSGIADPSQMQAVSGLVLSRYANDPVAQEIAWKEISIYLSDPKYQLLRQMMNHSGFVDAKNMSDKIRMSNDFTPEQKEFLLKKYSSIGKD